MCRAPARRDVRSTRSGLARSDERPPPTTDIGQGYLSVPSSRPSRVWSWCWVSQHPGLSAIGWPTPRAHPIPPAPSMYLTTLVCFGSTASRAGNACSSMATNRLKPCSSGGGRDEQRRPVAKREAPVHDDQPTRATRTGLSAPGKDWTSTSRHRSVTRNAFGDRFRMGGGPVPRRILSHRVGLDDRRRAGLRSARRPHCHLGRRRAWRLLIAGRNVVLPRVIALGRSEVTTLVSRRFCAPSARLSASVRRRSTTAVAPSAGLREWLTPRMPQAVPTTDRDDLDEGSHSGLHRGAAPRGCGVKSLPSETASGGMPVCRFTGSWLRVDLGCVPSGVGQTSTEGLWTS